MSTRLSAPVQGVHLQKGAVVFRGPSNYCSAHFRGTYRLKTNSSRWWQHRSRLSTFWVLGTIWYATVLYINIGQTMGVQ